MKKPADMPSELDAGPEPEMVDENEPVSSAEPASAQEPEPASDSQPAVPQPAVPQPTAPPQDGASTYSSALIPASPPPAVHVLPAASPVPPPPAKPRTDWGRVARSVLRTILLLILAVIFGGLLGLGVFMGLPWLYNRYVLPVQQHEQRLDVIESQYSEQVGALEAGSSDQQEQIDALETRLEELNNDFQVYQAGQSGSQEKLAKDLAALQTSIAEMESQLEVDFSTMDQSLQSQQDLVATLEAANLAQAENLQELRQQLTLLQAMELLSRARLFLTQNNLGLAQLEIEAALDHLAALRPDLTGNRAQVLENILYRLGLALQNLQTAPVLVVDDLEVAWQMLRRGLDAPALPLLVTPTPFTSTSELSETLVLTPTLTLTPATPYPAP